MSFVDCPFGYWLKNLSRLAPRGRLGVDDHSSPSYGFSVKLASRRTEGSHCVDVGPVLQQAAIKQRHRRSCTGTNEISHRRGLLGRHDVTGDMVDSSDAIGKRPGLFNGS